MLDGKQRKKVKETVLTAYREKYPQWQDVVVTEIVENLHFGIMVSVKAKECNDGEICVYRKSEVIIFDTTPELVRYLDMMASRVISLRDILTMIVVLVTLGLFAAVVFKFQRPEAIGLVIAAMAGILGAYTGVHLKSAAQDQP